MKYKIIYNPMPKLRPEWIAQNEERRKKLWGDMYIPISYPPELLPDSDRPTPPQEGERIDG